MSDPGSEKAETELPAEPDIEISSEPVRARRRRRGSIGAESSVNMDELRELIQLINENDFSEFELEREGFRVRFRRGVELSEASSAALVRPVSWRHQAQARLENRLSALCPLIPAQKPKPRRPKIRTFTSSLLPSWAPSIAPPLPTPMPL